MDREMAKFRYVTRTFPNWPQIRYVLPLGGGICVCMLYIFYNITYIYMCVFMCMCIYIQINIFTFKISPVCFCRETKQERASKLCCYIWLINCTKIYNKMWCVHSANTGFDITSVCSGHVSASCFVERGRKLNSGLCLSYHFMAGHALELLFLP